MNWFSWVHSPRKWDHLVIEYHGYSWLISVNFHFWWISVFCGLFWVFYITGVSFSLLYMWWSTCSVPPVHRGHCNHKWSFGTLNSRSQCTWSFHNENINKPKLRTETLNLCSCIRAFVNKKFCFPCIHENEVSLTFRIVFENKLPKTWSFGWNELNGVH